MNKKYFQNQSGMSVLPIIAIIVVVAVVGGYAVYKWSSPNEMKEDSMMEEDKMMSPTPEAMMEGDTMMAGGDSMMNLKFSGTVLAGAKSPLLDFNKADYDKAISSGKLVALYFYANWCPICKAEFPKMQDAFNRITDDSVIGFRVNYNDDQTDDNERELARQFGVAYQHTKVFVKADTRLLKAPESWESAEVYISKINEFK